jgi:hypothetical protein
MAQLRMQFRLPRASLLDAANVVVNLFREFQRNLGAQRTNSLANHRPSVIRGEL